MKKQFLKESGWNLLIFLLATLVTALLTHFEFVDIELHDLYITLNPWHLLLLTGVFTALGRYLILGSNRLSKLKPAVTFWLCLLLFALLVYSFLGVMAIIRFEKAMLTFYEEQLSLQHQFYIRKWLSIAGVIGLALIEAGLLRRLFIQLFSKK